MKFLVALLAFITLALSPNDLDNLRSLYTKASFSKANADRFSAMAEKVNSSEPAVKAYRAAASIIQAKFEKGNNRKTLLINGVRNLEQTIKFNPKNVELRVIRLSVQENLPKIVGYNKNLLEDKHFILKNYSKQSTELKSYIRDCASVSKTLTASEKASLK